MLNRVIEHSDFIEVEVVGDQSAPLTSHTIEEAVAASNKLIKRKLPVLVLADVSKVGKTNLDSFEVIVKGVAGHRFDRIAMVGKMGSVSEHLMNSLITGLREERRLRFFDDRNSAERWLMNK